MKDSVTRYVAVRRAEADAIAPLKASMGMRLATVATLCMFLIQACGGDHAAAPVVAPVNPTPTSIVAPDQSAVVNVTVTLPPGTPQSLASVSLNNSIGGVSVGPAGTFALPIFEGGPQYADVLAADGTEVALGFVSPTAATVDATSTAKVLIYFAGGFYSLPLPYRVDIVDQISTEAGFGDVVTAVTAAMVAGGIGSKTGAPLVTAALQVFVAALYAPANTAPAAVMAQQYRRSIKDVSVNPGDMQSGITVVNDFPNGVHFMNNYRRLATAYIDEVSFTGADGVEQAKAVTNIVAPIQIANTSGVGTVTSTAVDAARVLAGGAGDYNPVSTSSVPLALEQGSIKTTYNVTVVGPGARAGTAAVTAQQAGRIRELEIQQLLQNYLVPIACSIIVPISAGKIDTFFNAVGGNAAVADLIGTLGVAAPQIYDLMDQGNAADAATAAFNAIAQSNALQAALLQIVYDVITTEVGAGAANAAAARAQRLLVILNVASGVLVSYDLGVLTTQLGLSNRADSFAVTVIQPKVTLTPQKATTSTTATVNFTAAVPTSGDSGQAVVYTWANTAVNGHLIDGQADHRDNFDSSLATVTYVPLSNGKGDDTITVTAYLVNGTARTLIGTTSSVVTVQDNPWVGSWVGSTTSTCGSFSGALTLVITSDGGNSLHLGFGQPDGSVAGGYPLTIDATNPLLSTYNGGEVVDTLSGPNLNTLTSTEADSCQYGQFIKQ